jgi:hypothetical protein
MTEKMTKSPGFCCHRGNWHSYRDKLFLMDGFQEGDPCPGQSKENRQMANKLPDPISSSHEEGGQDRSTRDI